MNWEKYIKLLKNSILAETDDAKRKELEEELVEAIESQIREDTEKKVRKELAEEQKKKPAGKEYEGDDDEDEELKEFRAARARSKQALYVPGGGQVKVTSGPAVYKGFKLKAEADNLAFGSHIKSEKVKKYYADRPEKAEKMVKFWADLLDKAMKHPLSVDKAMEEGTESEGGYLVPSEQRTELLMYGREESIALQDCTHIPMTSDSMTIPREGTKVSVAYTDEESDATETTPAVGQVTLTAKRMDGYTKVSNELLEDAKVNGGIIGMLMSQFMEAIGQKVDSTVFVGTGDPVSGVFLSAGYSTVLGTGSAHFSMVVEKNFRDLEANTSDADDDNAKYYLHKQVLLKYVYDIKDDNGNPLFRRDLSVAYPEAVNGYPVRRVPKAPKTSAASTGFIVYGDLRGFLVGDRLTTIRLFVDPYSLSRSYQTQFLLFTRWAYAHGLPNKYARMVTAS